MSISELLKNKTEQEILSTTLISIINRLRLVKPQPQKGKITKSSYNPSNDSFLGNNPIPMISRLKKSRHNGIPRPSRALTAKYRPGIPRPGINRPPTANSTATLKYLPKGSKKLKKSKNNLKSASDYNLLRPIITKVSSSFGSGHMKF